MGKRTGKRTFEFSEPPHIAGAAAVVGKKEGKGPLADDFDMILEDDYAGRKSWDAAESRFQIEAANLAVKKCGFEKNDIDGILSGDLQNQCTASHYAMREFDFPYIGLYGACSTMTESLMLGAVLIDCGFFGNVLCGTSSHFCAAEKQFRFPLEYGGIRTPTSQWTVTGAGFAVLSKNVGSASVTSVTPGKIVDCGVCDINNMGGAMAAAAADTLITHFKDTEKTPNDYDLILTGDLGVIGSDIFCDLMNENGYDVYSKHADCGKLIYDIEKQDVHAGGSGCGCCASVLCGHILKEAERGKYNKIAVMATGALMNPQRVLQGESIPSVAHLVVIEK